MFAADEVRSWTLADACGDGARAEPNGAWTPDSALVWRIDEQVGRTLRRRLAAEGEHASPPMDYHRQYAGVYCDGAPVVVVEGSRLVASYTAQRRLRDAAADTFAWRRERFPRMSHAGTSFFQASYRVDGRPLRPLTFDCCRGSVPQP